LQSCNIQPFTSDETHRGPDPEGTHAMIAAAHIVIAEAGLGDSEIIIKTLDEDGRSAQEIESFPLIDPAADTLADTLAEHGWRVVGDPVDTDYCCYTIVEIEQV
jgi:hypothetical protein